MNGTTRVEVFEECTGVALPAGDWQPVAGYVIEALYDIPSVGDRIRKDVGEFEVLSMDGYAIDALQIRVAVSGHHGD